MNIYEVKPHRRKIETNAHIFFDDGWLSNGILSLIGSKSYVAFREKRQKSDLINHRRCLCHCKFLNLTLRDTIKIS
jgi:hypothetical protein